MPCSRRSCLVLLAAFIVAGCASTGGSASGSRQTDLITRQEIVDSDAGSAYDAIQRLRPHMLRARGGASIREGAVQSPPQVFVDGIELGSVDVLHDIPAATVHEIRYERYRDRQVALGTGNHGGVIHVRTSRP